MLPSLSIPNKAGIGLRSCHHSDIITRRPQISWLEVHAENYLAQSLSLSYLLKIRQDYPLSLHGVGMSLGSARELDVEHVKKIKDLANITAPDFISEHTTWSAIEDVYLNDLIPMPCSFEALELISEHVAHMQDILGQRIFMENPVRYIDYEQADMTEPQFLNEMAQKTGCGLLLDVSNLYINSCNHSFDAFEYFSQLDASLLGEIHLAGFSEQSFERKQILLDTHDSEVRPQVWQLYRRIISSCGLIPTLIEWDSDIPQIDILLMEARKADKIMSESEIKYDNVTEPAKRL